MIYRRTFARARVLVVFALTAVGAACSDTIFEVIPVASVQINGVPANGLGLGQVITLSAQLSGEGQALSGRTVTWSSNNTNVATVDAEGRVTGRAPGTTQITASAEGVSAQVTLSVNSGVPAIAAVSPTTTQPNVAFTLSVTGSGFYSGSTIHWNGQPRTTTFASATELRASISAADVASPGSVTITVVNAPPGGGTSNSATLGVNAPVPAITSVSPTITPPNASFTLSVIGTGFYSGSRINWNGSPRTTTFVSATELRANIPASDVANQGPVTITVVNPPPGGGTSGPATLTVRPADPCQFFQPYSITATVQGRLETADCRLNDNSFADIYTFTLAAPQQISFVMASTAVDAYLFMRDANGRGLGFNDDTGASNNSTLRMMLAAGTYRLYANANSNQTGDYGLSSQIGPANVANCAEVWIMPGLQTAGQSVATSDCRSPDGFYSDNYRVFLSGGTRVTLTLNSTDFDAFLIVRDASGAILAQDDDSGGGTNSQLTFTAPSDGMYVIEATTFNAGSVGAYTLVVQSP